MYTIVDLETTGFSPSRGDKIVEIAAVKLRENSKVVDKFSTLVNPMRDISNYHIHGIEPYFLKKAPTFSEVSTYFKSFLKNCTIVAHNANFDLRFLNSQLFNDKKTVKAICTIKLSRLVEPDLPNRKLGTLCNYFDIDLGSSHEALSDALATSELFSILKTLFINQHSKQRFEKEFASPVNDIQSSSNIRRIEYKRNDAIADYKKEKRKVNYLLNRLPTESISKNEEEKQDYLDTLNEILADRIISDEEIETLNELAVEFNFSQEDIRYLHKQYLREVIQIYLIDGVVSEFERTDLENLGELLGINSDELNKLIVLEKEKVSKSFQTIGNGSELKGKKVCFTGKLQSKIDGEQVSRSQAQKFAHQKGMSIKKNVSKKLDYLVAAKPSTMSGKAKKARKYDIPIIAEAEFWKMIGVNVE